MAIGRRRRDRGGIDAWPGYVDALSTLLMVIIFVLLVFVLAQGFLSVALSSRDRALDRLNRQVAELGELLALERGQAEELRGSLSRTAEELRAAASARDAAGRALAGLREERDRLSADRDLARGERDRLAARIADLDLGSRGDAARIAELEGRLAEALARAEAAGGDAAQTVRTLTDAQRVLAAERAALEAVRRDLSATREQAAALGRDLVAERAAREAAGRDLAQERGAREATERELAAARGESATLARDLGQVRGQRDELQRNLTRERTLRETAERDLNQSRQEAAALNRGIAAERDSRGQSERQLAEAEARTAQLARELAEARQVLEAARRDIAALRAEAERLDRTVQVDRATIEARLSDIARLADQVRGLEALRDQLERQAAQAIARAEEEERRRGAADGAAAEAERARRAAEALVAQATGRASQAEEARRQEAAQREAAQRASQAAGLLASEAASRAAEEARRRQAAEAQGQEFARLSESARVQVAQLTRQVEALRAELARVAGALDAAEDAGRDKDAQIAALGQRLNVALAARVEELQQYRSDFFGRLRRVVGDRPEVRIVGDRFVFQSEVLFPVGSAELSAAGQQQIRDLGRVLLDLARQFPADLSWVLRVDGHADRSPVRTGGRFATNWELSAARSIAVAQLLIQEGLPANRVAAAAFGDTQPLDDRDTPDAYARNRRIELRLEAGLSAGAAAPPARAPADARRDLGEVLRGQACTRLALAEEGVAPRVSGLGPRGVEARLRDALPGARIALAEFDGPYCAVLDALRPVGADGMRLAPLPGPVLRRGSLLQLDLGLPDWAAHALVAFISTDGQVGTLARLDRQAPGARLRLGEPRPGFAGWPVEEPFGTDLVVAIASEGPLFEASRLPGGSVQDFAASLRDAVAAARAAGRRVAAAASVVEVVPR
ncbi:peptidoglycan -binding protein [Falsiroseomonas sp. CW058]|uniref:peptidoglycan -binding protein n=1 Tax=Falsiroseomonas sp. CW058 TaxID=3388664 RepID=UPI003D32079E